MRWLCLIANVIHSNLNGRGGSERLAICTILALTKMDQFDVHLSTLEQPNPGRLVASFGQSLPGLFHKIKYIKIWKSLQKIKLSKKPSPTLTVNTHGDLVPFFHRFMKRTNSIIYCHFPVASYSIDAVDPVYLRFIRRQDILKKTGAYRTRSLSFLKDKYIQMIENSTILTNSKFSSNEIWKRFGVRATVLSPPVDVDTFSKARMFSRLDKLRTNTILVVSRFNPSKRVENAIRIASLLRRYKIGDGMVIVGTLSPSDFHYYLHLNRLVKDYDLKNFVRLETNATLDFLLNLMKQAKVYLHPLPGEPFGISTVEAMSAGLVAVVPNIGGHTEFVPRKYQFHTLGEGVEAIAEGIKAPESERRLLSDSVKKFSVTNYVQSFQNIVYDLLEEKSLLENNDILKASQVPISDTSMRIRN